MMTVDSVFFLGLAPQRAEDHSRVEERDDSGEVPGVDPVVAWKSEQHRPARPDIDEDPYDRHEKQNGCDCDSPQMRAQHECACPLCLLCHCVTACRRRGWLSESEEIWRIAQTG